ncbi:MAG: pseudouridine synthase [Candidatus Accumulibacter sp. UW26]
MALERLLRSQGFGTRSACRSLIEQGRVCVQGRICDDPAVQFPVRGLMFAVDDVVWTFREAAFLALNKPAGYECSRRPGHHASVYALLPAPLIARGVQAVGRLDQDTTGLLLFTDDGAFIHHYTSPRKQVPKVYEVTTRHAVDEAQIEALLSGVQLHDDPQPVLATACLRLDDRKLRLTVTQGRYHLVKRMVAAAGNRVESLHRVAIGGFLLPAALAVGQWMWLDVAELDLLARPG